MQFIELPYIQPAEKLEKLKPLSHRPWFTLLDSAGHDLNYNRYDIVVCEPTLGINFSNGKLSINNFADHSLPEINENKPLESLRKILSFYQKKSHQQSNETNLKLPFNGGLVGYISYDFGRHLETLPDTTDDAIALPWLKMGLYQWVLINDHKQKTTRVYNFGLKPSLWQQNVELVRRIYHAQTDSQQSENFSLVGEWESNTSKTEYAEAFNKIQNYIHAGDCYQVNYAQQFSCRYQGNSYQAYCKLSLANKAPFSAYMQCEEHQILSLSPERFIESHQGKVTTQPIKGTRPRSADPVEDKKLGEALKNSEKDKAENLMIVDLLRNDLSRTAAKASVKVGELFGHYRFESVHHLISTIESKLDERFDNFDLLATTLPGGSITGAPKIRAMEIIEELEKCKRNLYCGVIGYLDFNGNMDTNICIRTLIAKNNQLYCWAGGGLVADSEMEVEYQETFDKLAKILPVLAKSE
ncbi:aminodeoxychorismate synthase component I [Aliikangiella sp. G2MR2-5]|uniref:aminodeoxychorismate synthase component I n=1 Tax=Aliikangiella sp. G2MR2-5 TaxID=2788943 RepID=UPI0018A96F13|nr:aminodeoxychorismate synthase component I [Aliikangiella sp. G2MR2-5]